MKQFKSWQAPLFSFYSTQFYRDLAANGKGIGCKYLYCLLLIGCAVLPIRTFAEWSSSMYATMGDVVEQMPEVRIEQGTLVIDKDSPWLVSHPVTGDNLIEFDADSDRTRTDNAMVMVAKHNLFVRYSEDSEYQLPLKDIGTAKLTKNELRQYLNLAIVLWPLAVYLLSVPVNWFKCFLQVLAFSILGIIVAKLINAPVKYTGVLRICTCAVGIGITLDAIGNCFDFQFPLMEMAHWDLVKLIAVAVYTLFGVGANLSQPHFEPVFMDQPDSNNPEASP